jgi:hypothetical protein
VSSGASPPPWSWGVGGAQPDGGSLASASGPRRGGRGRHRRRRVAKSKTWPDSPRALAGRLRRAATFLRKIGIEIGFGREGRARTRTINITTTPRLFAPEKPGAPPSAPSASSAPMPKSNPDNGSSAQSPRTVAHNADGSGNGTPPTVRANPLKINAGTSADGADANPPPVVTSNPALGSSDKLSMARVMSVCIERRAGSGARPGEIDAVFPTLAQLRAGAVIIGADAFKGWPMLSAVVVNQNVSTGGHGAGDPQGLYRCRKGARLFNH